MKTFSPIFNVVFIILGFLACSLALSATALWSKRPRLFHVQHSVNVKEAV